MTDMQTLNDALMTVAFMVGLVIAMLAWVAAASALYRRQMYKVQIRTIEKYLEHMTIEPWMSGTMKRRQVLTFEGVDHD